MNFCSIKRIAIMSLALGLLTGISGPGSIKVPQSENLSNWTALLAHPLDENTFLAGAQNSLYVTASGFHGKWQKRSSFPSQDGEIKKLLYFPQIPGSVFVLTDLGLYRTTLNASGYETVYEKRKLSETLSDFTVQPGNPNRWFLGTNTGVLESKDAGASWHLFTPLERGPICFIRFSSGRLFAAYPHDLLTSQNLSLFQKVFPLSAPETAETLSSSELSEAAEKEPSLSDTCSLRDFSEDPLSNSLWLATARGIFESKDRGASWSRPASSGLLTRDLHFVTHDKKSGKIFTSDTRSVYEFSRGKNHWQEIPFSLANGAIRGLFAEKGVLKVITPSELLTHIILPDNIPAPATQKAPFVIRNLFRDLIRREPTALQIQRAVSRYHHTQNSKINRWQAGSRLRAVIPTLSFKKDFSFANNIDLDRGGTNDSDTFIEGPADTSRGWDLAVAWDLGDLIFSTNQTSIDSREKLMMELRHDLTSEATRLFYERRRLQMETLLTPAASEEDHFQRLLKIDELTALLDAMTNGFMSGQIERIYAEKPELAEIWEYSTSQGDRVTRSQEKKPNE